MPTNLVKIKMNASILVYLLFWLFSLLLVLYSSFWANSMSQSVIWGLLFMVSIPFLLLAIWMRGLRGSHLLILWSLFIFVSLLLWLGACKLSPNTNIEVCRYFDSTGLFVSFGLMAIVFALLSTGLSMRPDYEALSLRKGARDRSEIDQFYEIKIASIPSEDRDSELSPYRYAQLLNLSASFVANRWNQTQAVCHLLVLDQIFFLYDLLVVPEYEKDQEYLLDFSLQAILNRPEIIQNGATAIVYIDQIGSQALIDSLTRLGFLRMDPNSAESEKWSRRLWNLRVAELPEWTPFASVKGLYAYQAKEL